jgi:hypothetical protein
MKTSAVEARIDKFIDKYDPAIAAQLRDARARLRAMFPRGYELVFDNYNALVFGIACGERATGAFLSIAGYPRWITLFFLRGVDLEDPLGLLEGQGAQVRGIRLQSARDIDDAGVRALIAQAAAARHEMLAQAPQLKTLIKTVVSAQRQRRSAPSAKSARPACASKPAASKK